MRVGTIQTSLAGMALLVFVCGPIFANPVAAQESKRDLPETDPSSPRSYEQTADEYNRGLLELNRKPLAPQSLPSAEDYRIGPDDQLEITVLEASELNREPRVSATGEISLALIGTVHAQRLTARELELVVQELLRRTYIKEPHVSVQVREMQSHPVAVFGAVKKPGVFQIRQPKSVVELLSMAEGLDVDAGDTVIIEHVSENYGLPGNSSPPDATERVSGPHTIEISLKKLLETGDSTLNVMVNPGDVVKVPRAGVVYVVGEVKKPGGYELKSNENISVLQAIALAQGLTLTSSSSLARIIRTSGATGKRQEIPIDLNKILAGKKADPILEPRDIVFVPNSAARGALYRGMEAAISIGSGVAIYRR